MARLRDSLKVQARKFFGLKSIRSWTSYELLKDAGFGVEQIWDNLIEAYQDARDGSARRIQEAFRNRPLRPVDVVRGVSRHGDVFTDYLFDITETEDDKIVQEVRRALRSVPHGDSGNYFSIVAFGDEGRVFSTEYWGTKKDAYNAFTKQLQDFLIKYEQSAVINDIAVKIITPNSRNGAGGRSHIQASKVWKIISPNAKNNCAYKAVTLCLQKESHQVFLVDSKKLTTVSNDLKRRVKPKHSQYSNDEDLQLIANYKKVPIVLYDNVFEHIQTFEPVGEVGKPPNKRLARDALELQIRANHYHAMLRRTQINEPFVAPESDSIPTENVPIKSKDNLAEYDDKIVAWDLECTGNGTEGGVHKCYSMGIAWRNGGYESFWGLDAIKRGLDFIYENREMFHQHTFYAHNGGGYDMPFMFREGLLEDDRFRVDYCVEQDSKYIHVKVFVGDCVITFRDSLRLLPGSLDKLCKEFNVTHQKLTGEVDHDKITIDNWSSVPNLDKYLANDCKGLLEVMECFSKEVFNATAQDEFRSKEHFVKQLFEHAYGCEFVKKRPKFLGGLELDGYSEELQIAFEYQGEQHYNYVPFFHKTISAFEKLKADDEKKKALCAEHEVRLFRIPCWIKWGELPSYLSERLGKDVSTVEFNRGGKVGINMTSCFTGASLSKKSFFAGYYKADRFPVYTLNPETDKFIRDFYRGGRVEIFHQGRVPANKLYYYDFTSLYPWAGTKPLPYGKPVWVEKVDIENFFGFVSVLVKSRQGAKKPLHGLYEDGKFVFRHYVDYTPMTLFSEELKLGIESGMYDYKVQGGYKFESAPWMKKFFTDAFNKKAEAKKSGKPALEQTYKIIANSGYGFWGLRTSNRDCIKIQEAEKTSIYPYLEANKFMNYNEIGKYSIMRVLEDLPIKDFNVGVASAISSYSRCRLWSLIKDIESKGRRVYMCDTDSVITDIKLNDFPDLMEEYMWDGCGDDLGSLKNEADDHLKKKGKMSPQEIDKVREAEGGMIAFDECILGGCKFYALRKAGCKEDITKCKGFKKSKGEDLTFKDFEDLAGGGDPKKQKQVQFLCPKRNHVSANEKFAMRTPYVTKKFKFVYNKGIVNDDGSISAFWK